MRSTCHQTRWIIVGNRRMLCTDPAVAEHYIKALTLENMWYKIIIQNRVNMKGTHHIQPVNYFVTIEAEDISPYTLLYKAWRRDKEDVKRGTKLWEESGNFLIYKSNCPSFISFNYSIRYVFSISTTIWTCLHSLPEELLHSFQTHCSSGTDWQWGTSIIYRKAFLWRQ